MSYIYPSYNTEIKSIDGSTVYSRILRHVNFSIDNDDWELEGSKLAPFSELHQQMGEWGFSLYRTVFVDCTHDYIAYEEFHYFLPGISLMVVMKLQAEKDGYTIHISELNGYLNYTYFHNDIREFDKSNKRDFYRNKPHDAKFEKPARTLTLCAFVKFQNLIDSMNNIDVASAGTFLDRWMVSDYYEHLEEFVKNRGQATHFSESFCDSKDMLLKIERATNLKEKRMTHSDARKGTIIVF